MVRAWYYDNSDLDQRCPHLTDPPEFLDLDTLKEKTGVLYFKASKKRLFFQVKVFSEVKIVMILMILALLPNLFMKVVKD